MKQSYDVLLHIPSLRGGGAERVAVEVARYFIQQGNSTVFFIYDGTSSYDLPQGADVIVAGSVGHVRRVAEFRVLLSKIEVRAVVSFLPYANLISLLANIGLKRRPRLVVSEHRSYGRFNSVGIKERVKFAILKGLYKRSDSIVAVSRSVAEDLRQRLSKRAARKIVVINNPCCIQKNVLSERMHNVASRTILAVGRLVTEKGFDVLLAAFRNVSNRVEGVRLLIVGEGPCRAELEAQIDHLGLGAIVAMPGFSRNVADEYQQARLFVCSSRTEGFGNVLVEALSFGLPIVSTACGGPDEILAGGRYGVLVPVDDETALADAIVNALETTVDHEAQTARSRDFSLDVIGAHYAKVAGLIT
jgi:glycosyltransferase involved in cell wall biosynthesis